MEPFIWEIIREITNPSERSMILTTCRIQFPTSFDGGIDVAEQLLPYLDESDVVDEWVGIRSLTPDAEPIIGWTSVRGLSVVSDNVSGIQLSPVAGKIIADQVVHDGPTSYYESVSISRFDDYNDYR